MPTSGLTIKQHVGQTVTVTQSAGVATFDWSASDSHQCTLNANATVTFANTSAGQSVLLAFTQAASGGPFTINTWTSTIEWVGSTSAPAASVNPGNTLLVKIYSPTSGVFWGWNLGITDEASGGGGGGSSSNTNVIYGSGSNATVSNTATPTSLLSGAFDPTGSLTILGNTFQVGDTLQFAASGGFTNLAGATMNVGIYLGSTLILSNSTPITLASGAGGAYGFSNGWITCGAIGESGVVTGFAQLNIQNDTNNYVLNLYTDTPGSVTLDLTSNKTFDIKITWGASDPSNLAVIESLRLSYLGIPS